MEEQKAIYKITDRYMQGLKIVRFTVEKLADGKSTSASVEDIIKLARLNKVEGISALIDIVNQEYILDYKGNLRNIPIHKSAELRLVCRIIDGNQECIGYKASDSSGKTYKLSINKTWELASINCINDVKAKIISNRKALIGVNGFSISSLPRLEE